MVFLLKKRVAHSLIMFFIFFISLFVHSCIHSVIFDRLKGPVIF